MSTVTVVKKNGIVAIAADTLSSFGSRKMSAVHNKRASKIVRLAAVVRRPDRVGRQSRVLEHAVPHVASRRRSRRTAEIFDVFLRLHARLKRTSTA